MNDLKRKLKSIDLGMPHPKNDAALLGAQGILAGTPGYDLAKWMANEFNHNFDEYDSAIDSVYNLTREGGSKFHHIIDGQHDIWGAFKAVQNVKIDDGWARELGQSTEHLLRDTASISGINPFFSLTKDQFDKLGSMVSEIGIPKEYLADALTINGPELLGGSIALVSSIIMGAKPDPDRLSRFSGGCLISALASANPMLMPIAVGSMVYAIHKSENKKEVMIQVGKGSLVSGSAMLVSSLVGGPMWLGCVAGFMAALAVSNGVENLEKAFQKSKELIEPAVNISKSVTAKLA